MRSAGIHSECLDYNAPERNPTGDHLSLFGCHGQGGNQVGRPSLAPSGLRENRGREGDILSAGLAALPVIPALGRYRVRGPQEQTGAGLSSGGIKESRTDVQPFVVFFP